MPGDPLSCCLPDARALVGKPLFHSDDTGTKHDGRRHRKSWSYERRKTDNNYDPTNPSTFDKFLPPSEFRLPNCFSYRLFPVSPVRIRIALAKSWTKILPSPIWPVCADRMIAPIVFLQLIVGDHQFDFHLGHKIDAVLGPAVHLHMPLLPPKPAHLGNRHPQHPLLHQRFFYVFQFVMPNDRFNFFHNIRPRLKTNARQLANNVIR